MARLSIVEYMRYLEGSSNSRCVKEGEEILNAGHLILCGKMNASTLDCIKLCALCLQSSAVYSDPHQITGELIISKSVNVKTMTCTCKAGNSGRCKHISAVLVYCTRCIELPIKKAQSCNDDLYNNLSYTYQFFLFLLPFFGFRENLHDLELISPTDLKCVWSIQKKITTEKYQAVPIKDMPCFQNKIDQCNLLVDEHKIYNFFIDNLPDSAIAKHDEGRRSCSSNAKSEDVFDTDFYKLILDNASQSILMLEISSLEMFNENVCCMKVYDNLYSELPEIIIATAQQSNEWLAHRKYRITGSRIYELYTYSKNEWENKAVKYFYSKPFTSKYTKHGNLHEGEARYAFKIQTSANVVECGMVISHSNPWLGYSPDGIIFEGNKPVALLEIKCLFEGAVRTISEVLPNTKFLETRSSHVYSLKKKHKYYGQIQLGMALLNLPKCYFVLYASYDKSMKIIEVNFDYHFAKDMLQTVKFKFFNNMIHNICLS